MNKSDCLFCKIITGVHPSQKVYEDDRTYAFLDIHPINFVHTLVVPKTHAKSIHDIPSADFCALMETARKLSSVVKEATGAEGINIGINNGSVAGQVIFHLHVHIIPRLSDDGHRHWHGKDYQDDGIEVMAKKIRAASRMLV